MPKEKWGVPSQLEIIAIQFNTNISYLNFNMPKFREKFGEDTDKFWRVLNLVNDWLQDEKDLMHKKLNSIFEK